MCSTPIDLCGLKAAGERIRNQYLQWRRRCSGWTKEQLGWRRKKSPKSATLCNITVLSCHNVVACQKTSKTKYIKNNRGVSGTLQHPGPFISTQRLQKCEKEIFSQNSLLYEKLGWLEGESLSSLRRTWQHTLGLQICLSATYFPTCRTSWITSYGQT